MAEEIVSQFDVNITDASILTDVGQYDLLKHGALDALSLFENMFDPCLSGAASVIDVTGWAEELQLDKGPVYISLTFETPESVGDGVKNLCCNFRIYSILPIDLSGDEGGVVQGRAYALSFADVAYLENNETTQHLEITGEEGDPYFKGKISELVEKVTEAAQLGFETPNIEETGNSIYYKPAQGAYPVIRKDDEQKPFELIFQLAENSIHSENPNAVNFYFYQNKYGAYNFKSIESLIADGEPVATFKGGVTSTAENQKRRIINLSVIRHTDTLRLKNSGALVNTMKFYRPRPDAEKYKRWYRDSIGTVYFRINCRQKDHFPAAIFGFQQIEKGFAEWRYAWVEVYLAFDYEKNRPNWLVKPIERGGLRSWVVHEKDPDDEDDTRVFPFVLNGPYSDVNIFARPAFNTMEQGNDAYYDYEERRGWEAPGYRLDTEIWEDSCMKIQPIRGSFCRVVNREQQDEDGLEVSEPITPSGDEPAMKNNVIEQWAKCFDTFESVTTDLDDFPVLGSFPIVDMKVYFAEDNQPHYFFTAENAVDGECDEEDVEGGDGESTEDCKDETTREGAEEE